MNHVSLGIQAKVFRFELQAIKLIYNILILLLHSRACCLKFCDLF